MNLWVINHDVLLWTVGMFGLRCMEFWDSKSKLYVELSCRKLVFGHFHATCVDTCGYVSIHTALSFKNRSLNSVCIDTKSYESTHAIKFVKHVSIHVAMCRYVLC